jgi:hypothetical protein
MHTVYMDSKANDDVRRQRLYDGQLFVFSPRPSTIALCEFAKSMIEEAFGGIDPLEAQYHMPVEQYVAIVGPLKPKFIHHPETKRIMRELVADLGCDLDETFVDVPRLRMVTSDGYLTSGVGYAHHLHRDTWYSAPLAQLNWWLPIYDIESENSMAFHPAYWNKAVKNGSADFNYYEWNSVGRKDAAQHIKSDTRKQPKAEEPMELDPQVRVICPAGGAIVFSAAHMHSTVPNTAGRARYSIDFRTVNLADLRAGHSAPNLDSRPLGTSLRDFVRGRDAAAMPEEVVKQYDNVAAEGVLVYKPAE